MNYSINSTHAIAKFKQGNMGNRMYLETDANGSSTVTCHRRGEQINKWEAVEAHYLSKHAGTLLDGEPIISLPPKSVDLKKVDFSQEERYFYCRLEADSRAQFQA
ncbi:unnamed protein product [Lupinus luteus]|uniref:Uncharacterized protein n=1 Tax=Lupinus luteus TaxID=3873 RepID=A0AAV1XIH0_LUPLU